MLGSFASSSSHHEDLDLDLDHHHYFHHHHHHHRREIQLSPAVRMRQLLISCAELISTRPPDPSSSRRLLAILMANSNPNGDSTERLMHHFTRALSLLLNRYTSIFITTTIDPNPNSIPQTLLLSESDIDEHQESSALVQSAYLSLNQVTPFIRFSQLTANQAILDAIEGEEAIHILDFDIMHGLQWPPFMQAISERYPKPSLRISATGNDQQTLFRTGDRLAKFAVSLNLRFHFHPILIHNVEDDPTAFASSLVLRPGEALAVNCMHFLHQLLKTRDGVRVFLRMIRGMNPRVVTLAEREGNHNHPLFLQRFIEALDHYSAVFDSLEATMPPSNSERMNVEKVWFGREITNIVTFEKLRHERFRSWELMFRSSGFGNVPLSPYALSQAKLLLRLHYPSEGYQLHILDDSLFLGWQNQPLFSVSSWR